MKKKIALVISAFIVILALIIFLTQAGSGPAVARSKLWGICY
jgi:hypothetical protein